MQIDSINKVMFESSVNSYDSQTIEYGGYILHTFESSVNSYDSQTIYTETSIVRQFESSVNSYDSQTVVAILSRCVLV